MSRWVVFAAGADKSTTGADKSRQVDSSKRVNSLPLDTSRWVDLAARADTSRRVNFAAGTYTSRLVDLVPGAEKSRWFDLAAGADKS